MNNSEPFPFISLVDTCNQWSVLNSKTTKVECNSIIEMLNRTLDLQYNIFLQYCWTAGSPFGDLTNRDHDTSLLLTAFSKNLFSLYTATELTTHGFYGSARIILRNIFEFLLIAKFSSVSNDNSIVDSWQIGDDISVGRLVLRKLNEKNRIHLYQFWSDLCRYCHAMIFSQQVSLDAEKEIYEIKLNFVYLQILLECNYHLLVSHALNSSIKYNARVHGNLLNIPEYKKEINDIFKTNRMSLDKLPKSITKAFRAKWEISR